MSKRIPEEQYQKSFGGKFSSWLEGEKDPYLGTMEMKPQTQHQLEKSYLDKIAKEKETVFEKIYDPKTNKILAFFEKAYHVLAFLLCIFITVVLLITVSYLPRTGNAANPDNNEVSERYIEKGLQETGAVNIVAGMILDYRAFDTLGESHVLFIATMTVFILLMNDKKKSTGEGNSEQEAIENDRKFEPKNDAILQKVAFVLVPIIMIFGIYVVLNGHISPGGGFSGGAIIGAGLILYLNAFGFEKTEKFFTEKLYKGICFCSLSFYCLAKSYSFYTGANHIESIIPNGTPGAIISAGLILPLNICVGLVVACTMYAFYAMFRKGGF